jgi:hypothetical protein
MPNILKSCNNYVLVILALVLFIFIINYLDAKKYTLNNRPRESFDNLFDNPNYEKDRTKLYGSLFLDNLNEQIKNMTDPSITYDDKRIDIIKYSDILL